MGNNPDLSPPPGWTSQRTPTSLEAMTVLSTIQTGLSFLAAADDEGFESSLPIVISTRVSSGAIPAPLVASPDQCSPGLCGMPLALFGSILQSRAHL